MKSIIHLSDNERNLAVQVLLKVFGLKPTLEYSKS